MQDSTVRLIAYGAIAGLAFIQVVIGVSSAANSLRSIPGLLSPVLGLLTFLWLPLLCMFNNRPESFCPLATAKAHFVTTVVLTEAWFPMAGLLTADTVVTCKPDPHNPFSDAWARCRVSTSATMVAYLICAISTTVAIFIAVRARNLGLSANVSSLGRPQGNISLECDGRYIVLAYED